jgi:hypothetical protein
MRGSRLNTKEVDRKREDKTMDMSVDHGPIDKKVQRSCSNKTKQNKTK